MQVADLPMLPGPPQGQLKRRILETYLQNPFLDDDLSQLSLRLDANRFELLQALEELCQTRFLKEAGQRRYFLDLDFIAAAAPVAPVVDPDEGDHLLTLPAEALVALQSPVEADIDPQELLESLPYGTVLWRADGSLAMANQQAVKWLATDAEDLDADVFAQITGFHPNLVVEEEETVYFSLKEPHAIEVSMHSCSVGDETAVLVVMRDSSLQEETAQAQASLHEELFACLDEEMVTPLLLLEHFLESPDSEDLGRARAALEQMKGFLEDFLLLKRPDIDQQ